jgi:hypothetical protein
MSLLEGGFHFGPEAETSHGKRSLGRRAGGRRALRLVAAAGVGITYYPNGLTKDIAHGNGVVVTQGNDPKGLARPSSITASLSGTPLWATGTYQYDGTGNLWKIGPSWYHYDSLSRVSVGTVIPVPVGTGRTRRSPR